MRVLVTGATTPLGVELVEQLLADPGVEHVLAVGLDPDAVPASCRRARFTYRAIDLTRARAVRDLLFGPARVLGIDTVIHGAMPDVGVTRQLVLDSIRHPTIRRFIYQSSADVYAVRATDPTLLDEDVPLELDPAAPRSVRGRVEADLTVCSQLGRDELSIAILRYAEVLGDATGSQLSDYLRSRVCFRPLGFDPMINVLSAEDYARATVLAASHRATGVFNIAGADTLPLSMIIRRAGRRQVPIPGPMISPLYQLRTWAIGLAFRYDLNMRRFHFGGVLDGRRAARDLGFRPTHRCPLSGASTEPRGS